MNDCEQCKALLDDLAAARTEVERLQERLQGAATRNPSPVRSLLDTKRRLGEEEAERWARMFTQECRSSDCPHTAAEHYDARLHLACVFLNVIAERDAARADLGDAIHCVAFLKRDLDAAHASVERLTEAKLYGERVIALTERDAARDEVEAMRRELQPTLQCELRKLLDPDVWADHEVYSLANEIERAVLDRAAKEQGR